MESRPIEEVLFLRDEMANLAWAVERLVESPAERPLNRFEAYAGTEAASRTAVASAPTASPANARITVWRRKSPITGFR